MRKTSVRACVALAHFASIVAAHAEPQPSAVKTVRMLVPSCGVDLVDRAAFEGALRVELAAAGFSLKERHAEDVTDASSRTLALETAPCDRDATAVEVVVVEPQSGRRERRLVPVWDLDATARPRAVALASAELLVRAEFRDEKAVAPPPEAPTAVAPATQTVANPDATPSAAPETPNVAPAPDANAPLTTITEPSPASAPPMADTEVRRRPSSRAPSRTIGAAFEYRSYPVAHTPMLGGRGSVRFRLGGGPFELAVDAGGAGGSVTDALGTVHVAAATAGVSFAHVSGAEGVFVSVGPSLEVGYGHVSGEPGPNARGGAEGTFLAAALLAAGLRFEVAKATWIQAEALGGWSMSALRGFADDRAVAGTSGAMAVLRIGVGWAR